MLPGRKTARRRLARPGSRVSSSSAKANKRHCVHWTAVVVHRVFCFSPPFAALAVESRKVSNCYRAPEQASGQLDLRRNFTSRRSMGHASLAIITGPCKPESEDRAPCPPVCPFGANLKIRLLHWRRRLILINPFERQVVLYSESVSHRQSAGVGIELSRGHGLLKHGASVISPI